MHKKYYVELKCDLTELCGKYIKIVDKNTGTTHYGTILRTRFSKLGNLCDIKGFDNFVYSNVELDNPEDNHYFYGTYPLHWVIEWVNNTFVNKSIKYTSRSKTISGSFEIEDVILPMLHPKEQFFKEGFQHLKTLPISHAVRLVVKDKNTNKHKIITLEEGDSWRIVNHA